MQRPPGAHRLQIVLHLAGSRYASDEVLLVDVAHMTRALQHLFNRLGSLLLSGDSNERLPRSISSSLQLSLLGGRQTNSFEFSIAGPQPPYAPDVSLLFDVSQLLLDSLETASEAPVSADVERGIAQETYPLLDDWLRSLTPFARVDLTTEGRGIRRSTSFAPAAVRRAIRARAAVDTIYEERTVEGIVIAADLQRRTVSLRDDLGLEIRCWIAHDLPALALGQRVRIKGKAAISFEGRVASVRAGRVSAQPESAESQQFFVEGQTQQPAAVDPSTLRIPDLTDAEIDDFLNSLLDHRE